MVFVNEKISHEDRSKYGLDEIDKKFVVGRTKARDWTIDRDRNIYLRRVANGRDELFYQSTWSFYWKGKLLTVYLDTIDSSGGRGEPGWSHLRVRKLELPSSLVAKRGEILEDLKEALTVYKDAGVYSANTTYSVALDI